MTRHLSDGHFPGSSLPPGAIPLDSGGPIALTVEALEALAEPDKPERHMPAPTSRSAIGRRVIDAQRAAATAVDVATRAADARLELARRIDHLVAASEHTCNALETALDRLDALEHDVAAIRSALGRRTARRYFRALALFRP